MPLVQQDRCRTPRRPSAIVPWSGPVRNADWIASVIGYR
jgi:hypothetical protein